MKTIKPLRLLKVVAVIVFLSLLFIVYGCKKQNTVSPDNNQKDEVEAVFKQFNLKKATIPKGVTPIEFKTADEAKLFFTQLRTQTAKAKIEFELQLKGVKDLKINSSRENKQVDNSIKTEATEKGSSAGCVGIGVLGLYSICVTVNWSFIPTTLTSVSGTFFVDSHVANVVGPGVTAKSGDTSFNFSSGNVVSATGLSTAELFVNGSVIYYYSISGIGGSDTASYYGSAFYPAHQLSLSGTFQQF